MINGLIIQRRDVLNGRSFGSEELAQITRRVNLLAPPMDTTDLEAIARLLPRADVLFCDWRTPALEPTLLKQAECLKVVFYAGGSVRHLVSDDFWDRGIRITSGYAMNGLAVADYTTGVILIGLKHGFLHARYAHTNGRHSEKGPIPGAFDSTVGIISLGAVGRALLQRLRAFDLRVIAFDPYVSAEEAERLDVRLVELDELWAQADAVSLNTPQLPETLGLIQGRHFAMMKPGAIFINTARGAIVREREMIDALRQRPDLTAVLDVSAPEPPPPGSPLYSLSNVVLTPHIAGAVGRERLRLGRCMIDEFDRWRRGESMQWEITRESIVHMA